MQWSDFAHRCYGAPHPTAKGDMIRSHLTDLMRRHQLRGTELARLAQVNRSTVAALTRDRVLVDAVHEHPTSVAYTLPVRGA